MDLQGREGWGGWKPAKAGEDLTFTGVLMYVCMNWSEKDGHERRIIGVMWQWVRVFRAATYFKPAKTSLSIPHLRLNQAEGEQGSVKTDSHMLEQNSSMPT